MAVGEDTVHKADTTLADKWSLVRLQEFADHAVREKTNLIRKHIGDQHAQIGCRYHIFV